MELVKYDVTEAAISEMRSLYMALTVNDVDDQEGFEAVHSGRMVVKGARVAVEKQRKKYNEDAQKHIKGVNAAAKKIFDGLEPIESHLQEQEDIVINERKRIQSEKEQAEQKRIQGRINELASVGCVMSFFDVATLSDPEYEKLFSEKKEAFEAEQKRIAEAARIEAERLEKERVEREAEKKRLEAERAELDRIRREQETEKARLKAEQDKIDAEKKVAQEKKTKLRSNLLYLIGLSFDGEQYRFKDINVHWTEITTLSDIEFDALVEKIKPIVEQRRTEEKEKALAIAEQAAKDKTEREAKDKAEAEQKSKAEAERLEKLRPDKEKLVKYANEILSYPVPSIVSPEGRNIMAEVAKRLLATTNYILKSAREL